MQKLIICTFIFTQLFALGLFEKMAEIEGSYKLESSENFDGFLKEVGLGLLKRQAANLASSTVTFTKKGDNKWHQKTVSTFKNSEFEFEEGKEFDEDRADGTPVKSTITRDGNVLKHVQKGGKHDVTLTRTFTDDGFTLVCETNGVKSTRVYSRIKA